MKNSQLFVVMTVTVIPKKWLFNNENITKIQISINSNIVPDIEKRILIEISHSF